MKAKLGKIIKTCDVANDLAGTSGKVIELCVENADACGLLVLRMHGDARDFDPELKSRADRVVAELNQVDTLKDQLTVLQTKHDQLEQLYRLMYNFNPVYAMGNGKAAEFYRIMLEIERGNK